MGGIDSEASGSGEKSREESLLVLLDHLHTFSFVVVWADGRDAGLIGLLVDLERRPRNLKMQQAELPADSFRWVGFWLLHESTTVDQSLAFSVTTGSSASPFMWIVLSPRIIRISISADELL